MRVSKPIRFGIAASAVVALLSGCATENQATPPAASATAVASRSMSAAEAAQAWDGTTTYVIATLSVTDAFSGDPAALIDYSLAQLASQDEVDRGHFVRFSFEAPGQNADTTKELLASLSIDSARYAGGSSFEPANQALDDRYGTWPAAVPEPPASLITKD